MKSNITAKFQWTSALLSALFLGPASAGSGTASAGASQNPGAPGYCVIVVGKADSPDTVSPKHYQYCSRTSLEEAEAHLMSPEVQTQLGVNAVQSEDLLITLFEHTNYETEWWGPLIIYGAEGTCDTVGYDIPLDGWAWPWNIILSSARGFAECNSATFINNAGTVAEDFPLDVPYLGEELNDNVKRIRVYHR